MTLLLEVLLMFDQRSDAQNLKKSAHHHLLRNLGPMASLISPTKSLILHSFGSTRCRQTCSLHRHQWSQAVNHVLPHSRLSPVRDTEVASMMLALHARRLCHFECKMAYATRSSVQPFMIAMGYGFLECSRCFEAMYRVLPRDGWQTCTSTSNHVRIRMG